MPNPAIIIGGKILAGAASALYNSITGAKEAQAPAPTFGDKYRAQSLKKPKSPRGRKAASSAEKSK